MVYKLDGERGRIKCRLSEEVAVEAPWSNNFSCLTTLSQHWYR